jgi:CTP:molybdopterin cytidylyltransferase MocA
LSGDEGARAILRRHPPRLLALPGRHAVTDLDTPEDWARWRAARG